MDKKNNVDLDFIAADCKVSEDFESDAIIKNIEKLENEYSENSLIDIYNHFLSICKNQDVLLFLIKCVDKYRHGSSVSLLVSLLLDKENSDNVRRMSAKAIANSKDTAGVTPLLYCLNDKNENYKVRLACADALGRIGDKYAVAPLINLVQDEDEKSVYVRESAVVALGMLGDMRAIDPLVSILETKKGFIDKFTFLKERVIEALGKFNFSSSRVFNALVHSLQDESSCVRINAIEALMDSGDDRAYELIKGMLEDRDDEVKKNALIALYNMDGRDILDEILCVDSYCTYLKQEAQSLIDEYESCEEE